YDLTFVVFFMNADGQVYARYGSRDAESADSRQSLDGLHYTMKSVLEMHAREEKAFAPKGRETPRYLREETGFGRRGGCLHCHPAREISDDSLRRADRWSRDLIWRYPLPENVGLTLEVDRGNVVQAVAAGTPAAAAGLKPGDVLRRLGDVPVHSIADAQ